MKTTKKGSCTICNETKKEIGQVTPAERDEIKTLFERKNGLTELVRTFANDAEMIQSPLYEKVVQDIGTVSASFQKWWDDKSEQYQWENLPGYKWEINFESCTIYLCKQ